MSETATKTIGFMPRRSDWTREAFQARYESGHAPLAVKHFPFSRYRRNHLTDPAAEPGFDTVSEFWSCAVEETLGIMAGPIGDTMRADEAVFIDQSKQTAAVAEPVLTGSDDAPQLFLLRREGGQDAALIAFAEKAGAGLDLLRPMRDVAIPADAILRLAGNASALPPGWRVAHRLTVEPVETDPAELLGNRR